MGFTTQIFLFAFLPICLFGYYGVLALEQRSCFSRFFAKIRAKDLFLALAGLGFYAWSCFDGLFRLLIYIVVIYAVASLIERLRNAKLALGLVSDSDIKSIPLHWLIAALGIAAAVFCLVYTKYWDTVVSVWNWFFDTQIPTYAISAPLGISFLTFSAISYLADVSSGKAKSGTLLDCIVYLSFFPKIISGPIVLWRDFYPDFLRRKPSLTQLESGVSRIMIGFVKKVIIADTLGACVAKIPGTHIDVPTAWIGALLYMLQIYYDFAGYSDIAIGLSKLFGFDIKENFNFPYRSTSIGEFWRRWHISLGTWFRQYIYFPLGGSRRGLSTTLRNLGIVFLLTGIWHGNGWTYLVWGGVNGIMVILERLAAGNRIYEGTPKILKWFFTMTVTLFCWQIFRFGSLSDVLQWMKVAFGLIGYQNIHTWQYYFDAQIAVIAAFGAVGAAVFGLDRVQSGYRRLTSTALGYGIHQLVLVVLFVVSIMFMVNSDYSPFIYFQY